jgi:hypothetical protein
VPPPARIERSSGLASSGICRPKTSECWKIGKPELVARFEKFSSVHPHFPFMNSPSMILKCPHLVVKLPAVQPIPVKSICLWWIVKFRIISMDFCQQFRIPWILNYNQVFDKMKNPPGIIHHKKGEEVESRRN